MSRAPKRIARRWTLAQAVGGTAAGVVVYLLTGTLLWAVLGLLAGAFVVNLVAEQLTNGHTARRHR